MFEIENIIIRALDRVHENYYTTVYKNVEAFKNALSNRIGSYNDGNFERYGERVFCYELYHQLRLELDSIQKTNPHLFKGAILQGEVHKMMILELLERFEIPPLVGEIIPDFLLHTPGNADSHIFAMEVKCINNLTIQALEQDLKKLDQLITRYRYEHGYFLSVNIDVWHLRKLLAEIDLNHHYGRDRISIICRKNTSSKIAIWKL